MFHFNKKIAKNASYFLMFIQQNAGINIATHGKAKQTAQAVLPSL